MINPVDWLEKQALKYSDGDKPVYSRKHVGNIIGALATQLRLANPDPAEWKTVPVNPPEIMWGGLARAIVMWTRFDRPSQKSLLQHLKSSGETIPDWLAKECSDIDHVPPKGDVAVWIYRAMLDAAPSPPIKD